LGSAFFCGSGSGCLSLRHSRDILSIYNYQPAHGDSLQRKQGVGKAVAIEGLLSDGFEEVCVVNRKPSRRIVEKDSCCSASQPRHLLTVYGETWWGIV